MLEEKLAHLESAKQINDPSKNNKKVLYEAINALDLIDEHNTRYIYSFVLKSLYKNLSSLISENKIVMIILQLKIKIKIKEINRKPKQRN